MTTPPQTPPPQKQPYKRRWRPAPKPLPTTKEEIEAYVERHRIPWFGRDGVTVPSTWPRRAAGASPALFRKDLHALIERIGETAALAAEPGDPAERPLVQLRRLNNFFGGDWLLAREAEALTTTRPKCLFKKNGEPRSVGARFFAVCERAAKKLASRRGLTLSGLVWMFHREGIIMPMPRLRPARLIKRPTPKKVRPAPKAKGPAQGKGAPMKNQRQPSPPPREQPKRPPATPGFYRAVPQQQRPNRPDYHRGRTPIPEVYTSVRRPK